MTRAIITQALKDLAGTNEKVAKEAAEWFEDEAFDVAAREIGLDPDDFFQKLADLIKETHPTKRLKKANALQSELRK